MPPVFATAFLVGFVEWTCIEALRPYLKPSAELQQRRKAVLEALPSLRGKNLACWCPLPERGEPDSCHAALLLELVNRQRRFPRRGTR